MSSDPKVEDSKFTFGVRELREAKAAATAAAVTPLAVDEGTAKKVDKNLGFDPYNTSGSFDRKKNWVRVGKR
jgi:hypothetical protein